MALDEVFSSVSGMKPEEAADLLRLSREHRVPVQDVAAKPDYFKNGVVDPGNWQDLVARAPKTSSFLENPLQMAINQSPNRVRHLSELETYLNPLPSMHEGVKDLAVNSVMSAIGVVEAGRYGALGLIENPKPEVGNLEFATNPETHDTYDYKMFDPSNGVKAKDLRQILKKEWLQPTEIKPADVPGGEWVQQLFRTAPQIAAQYALSMATAGLGTAGSLAVGTAFMGSQIAGGQYKELTESGVDPERAWKAATTNAALQAPLEAITIEGIAKGHLKNWIKTKFPTQAGKALTIETAAIAGLSEFITETVQKYPEAAAEIWAKHEGATPREQFALFMDDFWKITREGLYEGSLAAPFGVFGGAVNAHYSRKAAEKNIQMHVDRLGAIATEIQRRDLLSHSPESVRDFVDHVTGGEVVYVEPAALNQLYQSDSIMSQEEINALLGITPEQVQTANETGEMVAVPVASYVTAVAEKPEIHAALKEHLAAEVDEGITLARVNKRNEEDVAKAQASVKQYNEELKAELEKTKTNLAAAATGLKGVPKDSINRIVDLLEKRAWAAYDNGQVASPTEWAKANQLQFNRAFGSTEEARAWVPAGLVEGVDYAVMNQNGRATVSFLSGKGIAEASQKGPLNTGPDTPSITPLGGSTPVSLTELEQAFADRAVSAVMQAERMAPSNDVDVILGENPELYSIHNIKPWKAKIAKWMQKNGKSKQEIADHLNAVDKQLAIFSALGPFEVEVFPQTVDPKNANPIRSNSDPIYKLSFDLSAMCVKRLSAQATRVRIEEQLGRPMSAPELTAMVAMFKIAGKPAPCLYCYVEAPRAKANEFLQTAYDLAFNTEAPPSGWGKESLDMLAAARAEVKQKGLAEADFRIVNDPAYGVPAEGVAERASKPELYGFLAKQYNNAKSNLPKLYAEYAGQILGIDQEKLDEIQNYAGFRYFSSSDFQYEHVVDLMQSFLDMQLREMKSHSYTKVWEYAKIFGQTRQKIQLSIFAKKDAAGNIVQDTWQGMDWEKAQELRSQSKDTGTILVAASDEIILWGLEQPWIDYIIPFHLSGVPKEYADDMQWVNYTGTQAEASLDPGVDAAKVRMHEMGTEKGISDEKGTKAYLELALKRRLLPVFHQFLFKDYDPNQTVMNKRGTKALSDQDKARLDAAKNRWREMVEKGEIDWGQINPAYFKLKKDYARTDTPFRSVKAKFDMPTVKQVLAKILEGDFPKATVETEIADKLIPLIREYEQSAEDIGLDKPPLALEVAHRELKAKLGESPDPQKAFEAYRRLAGEIEARDVSDRMNMTEQERIDTPPNTQTDALVVWGDSTTVLRNLEQDVRGAFAYQDGKAVITLFESSDVSTLLHEMVGHFFIHNLLRDTSAVTAQDRKTLLDFIGMTPEEWAVENAAYESGQISDRYRAGMERLASAVESYFYEGNAPSLATRGLFAKFKDWLTKTYKDISDIGVQISPEVRDVFDRLLAGQSEIAEMQRIESYHAKLPTEVLETLSPDDQDRYDRLVRGAREEAESILQARLLDHLTTNAKLARAEAKLQAEKTAAAEVDADPFYAMLAAIETDYKNDPRTVAKRYQDTALPMDQEYDWDVRAQDAGYSSGAHMAATILETPTRDQAIRAKVEAEMKAWSDLYLDKGKLREAAREAMYSDGGRELLAVEQQILQEKLGKVLKDSQLRYEAKLAAEKAVVDAKEILSARPLKDALRVQTYVASERKAAENSASALAKGDVAEAFLWKQKQLLGHALVQQSLNLRRETEKLEKYLKRQKGSKQEGWKSDDTDEGDLRSVTMRHFHAAAEILLRFGYKRSDYNPAMREENLAAYVARMTEENPDMVDIPEWIYGSDRVATPRELTIEELRDVVDSIKNIKLMARAGRNADGFVAIHGEDFGGLGEAVALAVAEAEANAKDVQQDAMGEIKKPGTMSRYLAGLKKPSQHLLHLDGYKDFGIWDRLLYHFVQSAQNLKSSLVGQVVDAIDAAYNSQGISKEQRQLDAHVKIAIPEWNTSVTKNTLRAITLNMGSKSNMERLLSSPPVGLPAGTTWDEASVRKVLGKYLTEADLRLTQKLWDAINLLYDPYNAMVKRMTGKDLPKIEAQPVVFELENGTQVQLRGGYYPLAQDPRASKVAELRADQKASEGFVGVMPYPNSGASKSRAKKAAYSVDLRLDNMISHITDVAQDIAFRPVMHDVNKIMRQDAVKEILRRKLGDAAYAQIGQWQKVIAKGRDAVADSSSPFDGLFNAIRQRTTIANLLLRPATVLQNAANPTLYGKAVQEFGEKDAFAAYLTYGWMGTADKPAYIPHALRGSQAAEDLRQLIYSLSPMMRDKMENPDYSLREMHGLIKYENSLMNFESTQKVGIKLALSHEKVVDFGSRVLAFADQLTDIPMWLGAFEKGRRLGMDDAAAARLADTVIERSTGSGRTIDTAGLQRGSAAERLFSMFMTFMNTQYNRWAMEYNIALKEKDAMRLMSFVATKYLLFGFVSALASFKWPDEDDDPWKWFAKEVLAWPVGMFPVMGSAFKGVIDKALGYKTFGYSISPAERGITDILKLIQNAQSDNKTLRENTEMGMQVAAFLFRYPDQINDWLNNAYDIATGEMEFQGTDIIRRRSKQER